MTKIDFNALNKWLLLAVIAVLVFFLPGVDLYSHLHFSWLYNYMMQNGFLIYDFSMLGGQQFIYTAGIVSYLLSGALWFLVGKASIMLLEIAGLIVLFFISNKLFGKKLTSFWLVLVFLFVLISDMYPYFVSLVLFYLGLYLIHTKKERLGEISVLLAGLNHPYVSIANLVFLFSKRKLLKIGVVLVLLVQIFLFGYKFFSGIGYEILPIAALLMIPHFFIRTIVFFIPLIVNRSYLNFVKKIKFSYIWAILLIGTLAIYHVSYTVEMPFSYKINCYYQDRYADVGQLDGNVRVVDICKVGLYTLPVQGNILTVSPYVEGQDYFVYWNSTRYLDYLEKKDAHYVIHCKNCTWFTGKLKHNNELEILQQNFPVYRETAEYYIFKIK